MGRGFTILELLVVVSLVAAMSSMSMLAGNDSYQSVLATGDLEQILGSLYRARALSQANACRVSPCNTLKSQGVRVDQGTVSLFEGDVYEESSVTESYSLRSELIVSPATIYFLPRTGAVSDGAIIRVRDSLGRERVVSVSTEGVISVN